MLIRTYLSRCSHPQILCKNLQFVDLYKYTQMTTPVTHSRIFDHPDKWILCQLAYPSATSNLSNCSSSMVSGVLRPHSPRCAADVHLGNGITRHDSLLMAKSVQTNDARGWIRLLVSGIRVGRRKCCRQVILVGALGPVCRTSFLQISHWAVYVACLGVPLVLGTLRVIVGNKEGCALPCIVLKSKLTPSQRRE